MVKKCVKLAKNVINSDIKCPSISFNEKISQIAFILVKISENVFVKWLKRHGTEPLIDTLL